MWRRLVGRCDCGLRIPGLIEAGLHHTPETTRPPGGGEVRHILIVAAMSFALSTTGALAQVPAELPAGWGNSTIGVFVFRHHQCEVCHHEWGGQSLAASTGGCFVDPVRM